ncbi:zinc-binding dehydrogenase [Alkalihalobacillus pseudalcaliphilus]|uniref:zinc-binding dehydrogenase n=1 Tax=Alkalihalobacillus pseudalcaliphilus TaxID=79884 RepID=UPI00064DE7D6|nr:alcohol dehydrogenase catalytic domain-containing protein [Alkalihalobacillus pseudalcaliphilus]KMK76877.1 hypothetical protein AB990_08270 [Alkalihalobacillus pseudalcaliphilus]
MDTTGKVKGIVIKEHGSLNQLDYNTELERAPLLNEEISIKVSYCGINHLDVWLREGGNGEKLSLPRIPGADVVGRIEEVGKGVTHLHVGDYVTVYPGKGCGLCESCSHGQETACRHFQILGYHFDGGYSQYVHVQAKRAVKVAKEDIRSWAGVPVSYVTAWNALVTKAQMKASDTVVIWGASGGLGFAALSIAKAFGASIIGIVSSQEKIDALRKLGFDDVTFILRDEQTASNVRKATGKAGADVVLDHVGAKTFQISLKMLKRNGRLAFCGVTTGSMAEVDLRLIFGKQIMITGSWMGDLQDFHELVRFLERTRAFPHIDQVFQLEDIQSAQQRLLDGKHIGKILLEV